MSAREARAKVVMRMILLMGSWVMARAKVVMMLLTMSSWINGPWLTLRPRPRWC